jgi:EAL domain-containing protein (putative c-di-GMP-specific phosphodiesterase class I)/ActR/RegA family two-component response regulator
MTEKSEMSIMVVDDEVFMRRLLILTLGNLGYSVAHAYGSAALALEAIDCAARPPDLILLDLNMPAMDGVEFVRYLVERNYAGSLILVSGEDERVLQAAEKLVRAHHITVLGHVRKPVTADTLGMLLRKWAPAVGSRVLSVHGTYAPAAVRLAIANRELVNYYQPMVSLVTGRVVGMETLVRWQHPVDGLVFPDQFIGVAEKNGLICDLTRTVCAGALAQTRIWREELGVPLQIAINVSMDDLASLDFADYIAGAVAAAAVPSHDVTLEVTESQWMADLRAPLEVLTRLRIKRFRLSIDDFGTGNSSLCQLRDIPFSELKIDRGFVHGACADATVRAIFDASVTLAKQLKMGVVSEGVEDRADWEFVRRSGCDIAQGYFIAKPMPADAVQDWIEEWDERALIAV